MSLKDHPRIGDWLTVRDGRIVLRSGKVDIGQRISTAIAGIAHEELTVPLDRIDIATVRTGAVPDEGITSGSNSIEQSGHAIRCATASLRALVIAEAVERFGGAPGDWTLAGGMLTGPGANRPVALIEIVEDLDLDQPVETDTRPMPATKSAPTAMRGLPEMVTGRYVFLHDLEMPGMLHARVVRPPHAKARLSGIPQKALNRLDEKGLHLVRDGSFLAIAGPDEWAVTDAALKFANACEWDLGSGLDEDDIFARLVTSNAQSFPIADSTPVKADVPPAPKAAQFTARYERPFTMHGALAPSAAMAEFTDGRLTVRTHSQGIYPLRDSIADSLGMPPDKVELIHTPGSGCYGHNGADDAAFEAALVAMAIPDTPILLKWTRAEEHEWEPYGTAMAAELAASLDSDGAIASYSADAISGTFRGRPRAGPDRAGSAKLIANHLRADPIGPHAAKPNWNRHGGMHRNLDPVYDFGDKRLVKNLVAEMPLRTSALRCLGNVVNVFALESFLDEIAKETGQDQWALREAHLSDPRALDVLKRLRELAGEKPEGTGRGIAYAQYKNEMTRVGILVDAEVNDLAETQLKRAVIVADAGRVVDRDGLAAQLEGGFVQGASWALHEEVAWDRDGVTSLDWETYPVIRFDQIPTFEIDILDRQDEPSVGAGEAAPGPAVAAIANAIFDATGIRMRRLPFTPEAVLGVAVRAESP